ncbi:MAG: ABC transporter ATP-binding protein [Fusicatenibacter sp.]|nr:ABC transporter ATP-binding protein [Fusicatenibacter sp.]
MNETETVISIKNVSKVYKLFEKPMDRLKESLSLTHKCYHSDHFALEDISLDVHKGECVGIIGTNGSGKSTLLKIVTGVLNPTLGSVELKGRVSAILELGAGFNMEYTGIENIFLNGTMLGYSEEEMRAKLDDIIAFAEIGDFINQPVKTYSSGMFARLAFAVAINVDPDILIVDEALSVGDIFFQSKCYRKFNDLKEAGKTILFVSHDMGSVIKYCERCLLINKGKQVMVGKSSEAVDIYKKILANQYDDETKTSNETGDMPETTDSAEKTAAKPDKTKGLWRERLIANAQLVEYGDKAAEIVDFAIVDHKGMITSSVDKNQRFRIKMKIHFNERMEHPIFAFSIKDRKGTEITGTNTALENYTREVVEAGETVTVCFDQVMPLQSGQYLMSFGCTSYHLEELVIHHRLYDACFLEVFSMKDTVGFFDMNSTVTYE